MTRLVVLNIIGMAMVVLGWTGVSGTARLSRQFGWIAVAAIGLLVAGFGNALWLLAGRQKIGIRLRHLPSAESLAPEAGTPVVKRVEALVAGPRMARYHHSTCVLVRSKPVREQPRVAHERAGRQPCLICRP